VILTLLVLLAWALTTAGTAGWYARAFTAADDEAFPPRVRDRDGSTRC
jgi:hypothetical protein